jgi:F0F1-type ATP synthase gamma subunit
MITKKIIEAQIKELSTLEQMSKAYALISANRMKKVRDEVLGTRLFLQDFGSVFEEVLSQYKGKGVTFLAHNGRVVNVFVSANARLYGQVMQDTFQKFMEESKSSDIEMTILGRYGMRLVKESGMGKPYTFFDISDTTIDVASLRVMLKHLVQYEEIRLYYPKFINVISQKPDVFVINAASRSIGKKQEKKRIYGFEPSAEKKLFLSFATFRTIFGSRQINAPSEFISDIPQDIIEREGEEPGIKTIYI